MLHLNEEEISGLLGDKHYQIIQYMEDVFKDWNKGSASMIPKTYLTNSNGDFRAMPASWDMYSGVKWISVFPRNRNFKLPTIHGTLILSKSWTGESIVTMDCATLTAYRTAAVSALAGKYLTNPEEINSISFIGCGYQAKIHAIMYDEVFPNLKNIKIYDKSKAQARKFMSWLCDNYIGSSWGIEKSVKRACNEADVVTTLTPSTEPYLKGEYLKDVKHINAVGADAKGKRELCDDVLQDNIIVVDDFDQASHSGEMQYNKDLPFRSLANIIEGVDGDYMKRIEGLTVFDSTGVAIEDIAIGRLIYERYHQRN